MRRSSLPLVVAAALVLGGCLAAPARPRPFGREPPGDPSFAPSPTGGSETYQQPAANPALAPLGPPPEVAPVQSGGARPPAKPGPPGP